MLKEWPCAGTQGTQIDNLSTYGRPAYKPSSLYPTTELFNQALLAQPSEDSIRRLSLKRLRSQEDIDGEEEEQTQRKKRRLRLELVTSRLSRPYATPATHIIGTKTWRVGTWARQRFAGGKLLRKAAIFNWIAMKKNRNSFDDVKNVKWQSGDVTSPPQSSLSKGRLAQQTSAVSTTLSTLSDYDAFDYEEDDIGDEEGDQDEELEYEAREDDFEGHNQPIHSDFRLLESTDTDAEFYDTSWSFADTESPGFESSGEEIRLVIENETKDEVSIAPTKPESGDSLHSRMLAIGV